jgi:hypothetical protein
MCNSPPFPPSYNQHPMYQPIALTISSASCNLYQAFEAGTAFGYTTVIFQPLIQLFSNMGNELVLLYNQLTIFMMTISSIFAHNLFYHAQLYIQQMSTGVSAATPRQLADARSQWIRYVRAMFQPTLSRIRCGISGMFKPKGRK